MICKKVILPAGMQFDLTKQFAYNIDLTKNSNSGNDTTIRTPFKMLRTLTLRAKALSPLGDRVLVKKAMMETKVRSKTHACRGDWGS